jgi:hypothetical protein
MYALVSVDKKNQKDIHYWCMPISPKCCALLISKEHRNLFMNGDIIRGLYIDTDEEIRQHNDIALESEKISSKKFIVGDITELERLRFLIS